MMAPEAAFKEVANRKLRRLLAYSGSFDCSFVKIGNSVLFYGAANHKSAPRRSSPAKMSDIDGTGATAKFQSQTFKVARACAMKKMEPQDAGELERNPASAASDTGGEAPLADLGESRKNVELPFGREGGLTARIAALPKE